MVAARLRILVAVCGVIASTAPTTAAQSVLSCSAVPQFGCRTATIANKSSLVMRASTPSLTWKWLHGDATTAADFGDPLNTTSYLLCIYDQTGGVPTLVTGASAPSGGTCRSKACWTQTKTGFQYVNRDLTSDGISKIVLTSGASGKAKITLSAKGALLQFPSLPLHQDTAVVVQLSNTSGTCWEARHPSPATTSTASSFQDKAEAGPVRFGVQASMGKRPDTLADVTDLGGKWMRLNAPLDQSLPDFQSFLDGGQNLVITMVNRDPTNIDTTFGTAGTWPNAGFPFQSKQLYQQRIRDLLSPLLPSIAAGRQVWLQCENEIGDASISPGSRYWRGTIDQYLATLDAFHEAVQQASPPVPVVLSSFTSDALDKVLDPSNPNDPNYRYATTLLTRLLTKGSYEAADLHFYGCADSIPAKVAWVKALLPSGRRWMSTENGGPDFVECPGAPSWLDDLTGFETAQAAEISTRLAACADGGGSICLWFSLFDLVNEVDRFNHLGLIDPRGQTPRLKPAYAAFKSFTATHH